MNSWPRPGRASSPEIYRSVPSVHEPELQPSEESIEERLSGPTPTLIRWVCTGPWVLYFLTSSSAILMVASGKEPACQCRRQKRCGFHPWVGKIPWRRKCQPLQCSCLENPMDRGACQATARRVAKSQTRLKRLSTHAQPS